MTKASLDPLNPGILESFTSTNLKKSLFSKPQNRNLEIMSLLKNQYNFHCNFVFLLLKTQIFHKEISKGQVI